MKKLHTKVHHPITAIFKALGRLIQRRPREDPALYPPPELKKDEALGYLYRVAYNDPSKWVCETCLQLHPVSQTDILSTPGNTTCPHDQGQVSEPEPASPSAMRLRMFPRHIKMTLKYLRLDSEGSLDHAQRQHLQALLTPQYYTAYTSSQPKGFSDDLKPKVWIVIRPSIETKTYCIKGNFWYHKTYLGGPISTETLGTAELCSHQFFNFDVKDWRERPLSLLCMLVEQALGTKDGNRLEGRCEWCGMIFFIRHDNRGLEIAFYRCLGREGRFEKGLCMCGPCDRSRDEA